MILQVVRPPYGLPESGTHWFVTYHSHHRKSLSMTAAVHDPCLLCILKCLSASRISSPVPRGATYPQTDDILHMSNKSFFGQEEVVSKRFLSNPKNILNDGQKLKFKGGIISKVDRVVTLTQPQQIFKLEKISVFKVELSSFISQRTRGAYIASVCRPDLTFGFAVCSLVTNPDKIAATRLNKFIDIAKSTPEQGLSFVPLDADSVRLVVFADASFASNVDMTSQLGFVVGLIDKNN